MGEHIPAMQHMVDVATRNEQANTWFLHDAAENNGEAAQHLADLYTFDWDDNGDAVSGYTDWIHDALDRQNEGDPDTADRWEMAQRASVDVIDAVTDTGNDEGRPNVFRQLMGGAQEDAKSFGMINPQIADSLGDVAARNLDALGGDPSIKSTEIGPDDGVQVAEDDRGRLFTLVNTDPDAAEDLNAQVGVYQAEQLRAAIKAGDDDALKIAAKTNGTLEGYMNAGPLNAYLIGQHLDYKVDQSEYEDAQKAAGLAKGVAITGLSVHPYSALTAPMANEAGDMLIERLIPEQEDPDSYYVDDSGDDGALKTRAAYDYLQARQEITGQSPDDESLTNENGDLKPWDQLSSDARQRLEMEDDVDVYTDNYPAAARFTLAALDETGVYDEERADAYLTFLDGEK